MSPILNLQTHPDIWVTPQELAEHWRVSRRTVYRLCEKGSLRHVRVGQQIRVNIEDALHHGRPQEISRSA